METRKAHHQRENELCKCWSEMRNQKHAPPAIPNNDNPGQNPVHQAPTSVPCFQDRAKLFSDPGPLLAGKKESKWRQSSKTGCSPTTVTKCHVTHLVFVCVLIVAYTIVELKIVWLDSTTCPNTHSCWWTACHWIYTLDKHTNIWSQDAPYQITYLSFP